MTEYTQVTVATLTRALNDTDKLGHITQALLTTQCKALGDTCIADLPEKATTYLSTLRQLHILHKAKIQLHHQGEDITTNITPLMTKLSQMGEGITIPPAITYPLHKMGILDHTQLINPEGTHIISCLDLQNVTVQNRLSLNPTK